jgi:hypothetical protein
MEGERGGRGFAGLDGAGEEVGRYDLHGPSFRDSWLCLGWAALSLGSSCSESDGWRVLVGCIKAVWDFFSRREVAESESWFRGSDGSSVMVTMPSQQKVLSAMLWIYNAT